MIQDYIYNEDGVISVEITPSNIHLAIKYIKENSINSIFLESKKNNEFKDYDFLNDINEFVNEISLVGSTSKIEKFPILDNVNKLFITNYKEKITFNRFPNLKEATLDWNSKVCFEGSPVLDKLTIWGYKPKSKNLTELSYLKKLTELELNQTNVSSLEGVELLTSLKIFKIYQAPKISSVKDLNNSKSLQFFLIDTAKKIKDYDFIEDIKSLEVLAFNNCGDISNLSFLNRITHLKEFRFVNTKVIDGDLSPCLKLQKVIFNNKNHYSHKYEYFKNLN